MNKLDALELSKKLNNMVITSSEFIKAYDGITSCAEQTKAYQKPIGSLLIAEGGLGKTTLSQVILKRILVMKNKKMATPKSSSCVLYTNPIASNS